MASAVPTPYTRRLKCLGEPLPTHASSSSSSFVGPEGSVIVCWPWYERAGVKGPPVSYPAVPVTKNKTHYFSMASMRDANAEDGPGSTLPHLQHRLESVLGLWQSHKKLDQRSDLVESSPLDDLVENFHLFFMSVFRQIIQLYRADGWHKKGKENLWLREGGTSSLQSSSMFRLARSGYGGIS